MSIRDVISGSILTEDFVSRHLKLLTLIVVLIIIFISNSYSCMKKMKQVETLKVRLKDARYENLSIFMDLTSTSRQSQVEELLKERGINLSSPTDPAIEIKK
jgi:hypothetical protein